LNASVAFDLALTRKFAQFKANFVRSNNDIFSNETQESLSRKSELISQRMENGRSFSEICDDPDVYLGRIDRDYVYHLRLSDTPLSLADWRMNYLVGEALREIESHKF